MTASRRSNSLRKKMRRSASEAPSRKTSPDALPRLLAEMLAATGGPLTRKERKAADRVLAATVLKG